VRAVEKAIAGLLIDVTLEPHERRRLALAMIEAFTSVGIILVQRHHKPPTSTDAPETGQSDTSKGKTD
jgi:hypothetical protein